MVMTMSCLAMESSSQTKRGAILTPVSSQMEMELMRKLRLGEKLVSKTILTVRMDLDGEEPWGG
jgi:hypothetical protein